MIFNDLPKTFGIYKFTNKINGRIYIGKSNNLRYRIKHHLRKSANQVIDRAIKKYGLDNFDIEIIDTFENIDNTELLALETSYIEYFESLVGQNGYNICLFGLNNTGCKVSNETKYKISIAHFGKKLSQEHRRKISLSSLGRKASEETKIKISISRLGDKNPNKKWKAYGNPTFNKNIYHFQNRITNETFTGYQYDFYTKYNLRSTNVNRIISGKDKSFKNWIFLGRL